MEKIKQMLSGNKDENSSTNPEIGGVGDKSTSGAGSGVTGHNSSATTTSSIGGGIADEGSMTSSLPDRSITSPSSTTTTAAPNSNVQPTFTEKAYQFGDSHPTFTGNRLDPEFKESKESYHEEKLDDETHRGGGWKGSRPNTAASDNQSTSSPLAASTAGTAAAATTSGLGSQDQGTGPASSTLGPHSSNLANIVDPRVQPDVAAARHGEVAATATSSAMGQGVGKQSDTGPASETTGPHESNLANIVDPRVQPDVAAARQGEIGYTDTSGRTAAATSQQPTADTAPLASTAATKHAYHDAGLALGPGGAGAAGMAAYEAKDGSTSSTPLESADKTPQVEHQKTSSPVAEGEKHQGFLNKLLHRDHPNKLHKDPPS